MIARPAAVAIAVLVASSCSVPVVAPETLTGASPALAGLRVAEPDPGRPRYDRDEWQPRGWSDADGDGCNTRAEVLMAESSTPAVIEGRCRVAAGTWRDPYTGRSTSSAADLQIDHLVALADAHRSGGWAWPAEAKVAFANDLVDPEALNAVWGRENERKSDDGPDRWLPPETSYRCAYVAAYGRIKARWDLSVTPAQAAAIAAVSAQCAATATVP